MKAKNNLSKKSLLTVPYGVYMAVFTIVPMILILLFAFMENDGVGGIKFSFTFQHFINAFSGTNLTVFLNSLWIGLVTTAICLVLAYPIAYFLGNAKYNTSPIFVLLFVLPMWVNFLLRTNATKGMFDTLGIPLGMGAVIFGLVYNFLPFMILPLYTSIKKIDKSLLEASGDLGATEFKTILKVVLPLSVPGIMSGFTMVFVPSITTFVVTNMLSNNSIFLVGNLIEINMKNPATYGIGSAISLAVLLVIFVIMTVVNRFDKDGDTKGGGLW